MKKAIFIFAAVIAAVQIAPRYAAGAEEPAPSRFQSMTKSAREMMPGVPSLPSLSLPSMPDLSLPSLPDLSMPNFSDASGRLMNEFYSFTQQVGDTLPVLEAMGYEVVMFKVTWGLPPKARLRLRSKAETDAGKVTAIVAKVPNAGMLSNALISSAMTAKRIQSSMKLGTAVLDVDFAVPPRVSMKFGNVKTAEKDEILRDVDELEVSCR
jgi:peroxiredoxin family protein